MTCKTITYCVLECGTPYTPGCGATFDGRASARPYEPMEVRMAAEEAGWACFGASVGDGMQADLCPDCKAKLLND